jgi:hypothetical protein
MSGVATASDNPRWEPRFIDRWIIDLVSHWGEWRHPRLVSPGARSELLCTAARNARHDAERMGYVIDSGPEGYRVVDLYHPQRIYLLKPGAPLREEEAEHPGQLTLAECVGVE